MIFIDNIVSTIQFTGGISLLFREIERRLLRDELAFSRIDYLPKLASGFSRIKKKRMLERYRSCEIEGCASKAIFHSTYYRLPSVLSSFYKVTTVHDFTYERCVGGIRAAVHSRQKKAAVISSDAIICVSQNTRSDLIEFIPEVAQERIFVVYNGVSDAFLPLPCEEKQDQVIFVGQRGRYKNFNSLVKALSMCPGVDLVCAGGGDFEAGEIELMNKLIPNRFRHLGYVSERDLNVEYNRSRALVYPSLYEGFGIPVVEAMKAGCPVIAVNTSSIPEVAGGAAALLEKGEPDEIKTAIDHVMTDGVSGRLAAAGKVNAERFSWESTYAGTVDIYRKLMPQL